MDNLDEQINQAAADAQDVAYHQAPSDTVGVPHEQAEPVHVSSPSHRMRYLMAVLAVALVAAAAFAAWFFLLRPTPERILGRMAERMGTAKAFEYDFAVKGNVEQKAVPLPPNPPINAGVAIQREDRKSDFSFSAEGVYDARDENDVRFSTKLTGSASDGKRRYAGEIEARFLDSQGYLRLAKAPEDFKQYTSPFLGQWIKFGESDTKQGKDEVIKQRESKLTEENVRDISRILGETGAVTLEYKGSEKIDGDAVDVVGYRLDKEGLKKAVPEIYRVVEGKEAPAAEVRSFNESLKPVTFKPGEIAVDKKTKVLRKLTFGITASEDGTEADVDVTLGLKNYDDQVGSVDAPGQSLTFEEMLAKTAEDADKDGLSYLEEITYGSDPARRDTDGDSFPDGIEVRGGYNPAGPGQLQGDIFGLGLNPAGSGTGSRTEATPGPYSSSSVLTGSSAR